MNEKLPHLLFRNMKRRRLTTDSQIIIQLRSANIECFYFTLHICHMCSTYTQINFSYSNLMITSQANSMAAYQASNNIAIVSNTYKTYATISLNKPMCTCLCKKKNCKGPHNVVTTHKNAQESFPFQQAEKEGQKLNTQKGNLLARLFNFKDVPNSQFLVTMACLPTQPINSKMVKFSLPCT